jgi:hypothetical protein
MAAANRYDLKDSLLQYSYPAAFYIAHLAFNFYSGGREITPYHVVSKNVVAIFIIVPH